MAAKIAKQWVSCLSSVKSGGVYLPIKTPVQLEAKLAETLRAKGVVVFVSAPSGAEAEEAAE